MEKVKQKDKDDLCYVCHKNAINIMVMPCMHAYLCKKCAMRMASGKCKICKEFYIDVKGIIPGEPINNYNNEDEDEIEEGEKGVGEK